ncbi:hypothetical protein P255_00509 [Acinetobacter brisouii CIP 110357]|uniref:BioF2-like acetyltransferase domain-containing protein n=1 Tax=Acinetobacter brisouii CIP 110357 TaxID=1341683 RepID=V2UD29_9GAMM|nr:GNAT family N-acetyltransferase [Acinetobacter brisouii]ENV46370.1 hypothetical protein F954_02349 [Acinetobacter brisouii ANC 4119]ESK52358.1 hypothetical protein P255_00509 [Acinetobacter brisouii CIP 110357]
MSVEINLNQLEPQALIDAFLKYPPETFEVQSSKEGLPYFTTQFNLLTTLDIPVRQKVESIFGYQFWGKLLYLSTCFIGTTVTEYTLLPKDYQIDEIVENLKKNSKNNTLTIIKDLPLNSPLLTDFENQYSQKLISAAEKRGFLSLEGQALAYVAIDFQDREDYLSRFSKSRRKNLKRKLKSLDELRLEIVDTGSDIFKKHDFRAHLYQLYLAVYHQSEIHFDLLRSEFFDEILQDPNSGGKVFLYWKDDILVGYNICYEYKNNLIDKYIGLNYALATDYNLYFISWFVNLDYAKKHNLNFYIAGWTDPEVKSKLGASFTFTRHLVWIRQPVLRFILRKMRHLFESDTHWYEQSQESKS